MRRDKRMLDTTPDCPTLCRVAISSGITQYPNLTSAQFTCGLTPGCKRARSTSSTSPDGGSTAMWTAAMISASPWSSQNLGRSLLGQFEQPSMRRCILLIQLWNSCKKVFLLLATTRFLCKTFQGIALACILPVPLLFLEPHIDTSKD